MERGVLTQQETLWQPLADVKEVISQQRAGSFKGCLFWFVQQDHRLLRCNLVTRQSRRVSAIFMRRVSLN